MKVEGTRVTIVNPTKLFNAYETWLTVGTPTYCPSGNWINPADLIIAKELRSMGCDVTYIDGDNGIFTHEEVRQKVLQSNPDIIIVNSESYNYYRTPLSSYSNILESVGPDVVRETGAVSILYGVHPMIETPPNYFNYVIAGEGETTVPKIVETILKGDNSLRRYQNGYVEPNLDNYCLPAYDLVEESLSECSDFAAKLGDQKFTQVVSSRGCPHNCAFCFRQGSGSTWRTRSVENIITELEMLKTRGFTGFYFIDDYFGADVKHLRNLLEELIPLGIEWSCQTEIKTLLHDGIPELMKEAGCTSVGVGAESYNDKILRNVGKPHTVKMIDTAVANAQKADLDLITFIVLMLPGETEATLARTERWLTANDFHSQGGFISVPYPSTPLALQNRIYSVITALERAGTINTDWKNEIAVRRRWKRFDEEFGKPPVIDTIRKYRPDIYTKYREGEDMIEV